MNKYRLIFTKTGRAIYISHLDLMHTLQRAFSRAELMLKYSEGFNPHPQISIALPLSLGVESLCEVLDFTLTEETDTETIKEKLNSALPEGISVSSVYEPVNKASGIKWLKVEGSLEYDRGNAESAAEAINAMFASPETITIEKKTKRGSAELNIADGVRSIKAECRDGNTVKIEAVLSAREPSFNPALIIDAIERYSPEIMPDFCKFRRIDVFDEEMHQFQ